MVSGTVFLAIRTNGTLWTWGKNNVGQLGLGDASTGYPSYIKKYRSSPVQVGTLGTWSSVWSGVSNSFATKTDGTVWAWGQNGNGILGIGDTYSRSSPVQVGTLATWTQVTVAGAASGALKSA